MLRRGVFLQQTQKKYPTQKEKKMLQRKKDGQNVALRFVTKNNIRKESELMQAALQRSQNREKKLQTFF